VYANRSILAASQSHDRSNFKVMLEGSFKEAGKYEIHVNEIEVDVFKMIIEWIYTMDIRLLNGPSPSILVDLEQVYEAANFYWMTSLCVSIEKYLIFLINKQNFGEIYRISKKIGNDAVGEAVYLAWISNPIKWSTNDVQIRILIQSEKKELASKKIEDAEKNALARKKEDAGAGYKFKFEVASEEEHVIDENAENEAIIDTILQKIHRTSKWNMDIERKLYVTRKLVTTLSAS
jgi:hypothetical protein